MIGHLGPVGGADGLRALARRGAVCYLRGVRPLRLPAMWLLGAAATLAPASALAHGGGGAMPVEVPPAPPGDGATAQSILHDLEAKAAQDPESARVTAEPIKTAKRALERAHGARVSGDDAHARMLYGVALEWAEAARDFDRAAAAEKVAAAAGKKAYEAQTKAERARALLEETQARRGRTAAELARVESESKEAARGAADTEAKRLETTKKKSAVPPKPPASPKPPAPSKPKAPPKGAK